MKGFVIIALIFLSWAHAQEPKKKGAEDKDSRKRTPLSSKYFSGRFLIYDCLAQHHACVDDIGLEGCRENRDNALAEEKRRIPCVPLKNFISETECINQLYKRLGLAHKNLYCLNEIEVDF